MKVYPDITIMHRGKNWVIIELKESSRIKQSNAELEREKIRQELKFLRAKRGYFFYVARRGKHKVLRGPKGQKYGFVFWEIPITLERSGMDPDEVDAFQKEFRKRAKFRG